MVIYTQFEVFWCRRIVLGALFAHLHCGCKLCIYAVTIFDKSARCGLFGAIERKVFLPIYKYIFF